MSEREAEATAAAWEKFCDDLKAAGKVLLREQTPADELTRAEGLRKLVRLIRNGFEATLEYADPYHPQIYQSVTATTTGEGETSDARYHQAFIDGSGTYRVTGRRGQAPFIEFTVYAGKIGLDEQSAQIGALTERDLDVAADGSFEIVLGPEERPGNSIRTSPDASLLYIRQYAHDWSQTRGARFEIQREGVAGPRPPLRVAEVTDALARTAAYANRSIHTWAAIVDARAGSSEPNVIVTYPQQEAEDAPEMPTGHRFATGYYRLAEDEALLVTFQPADVPYWGLDLTNYWFEPLSYDDHRCHVNNRTAKLEADGSVRVAIGDAGGGAANWLDTAGHREGMILFRWSRTNEPVPAIATRVVKASEL
jgi:hypothetical protein